MKKVSAWVWRVLPLVTLAGLARAAPPAPAPLDPEWTAPQPPFLIYGNTYYVGTRGLGAILITSRSGHILIDGTVAEAATQVAQHVRALGFDVHDIRLILNTHVHFDHAGGIAALQKATGAEVAASPWSAWVLRHGRLAADDPQYASLDRVPDKVANVRIIGDGQTLSAGTLRVTAHFTPGHTPGGTTWTWESCAQGRCLHVVYADSLSAISSPEFKFSRHPEALEQFQHSFAVLSGLPCDILLTPHPAASDMYERLAHRDGGAGAQAFVDANACRAYADSARGGLQRRLASEGQSP